MNKRITYSITGPEKSGAKSGPVALLPNEYCVASRSPGLNEKRKFHSWHDGFGAINRRNRIIYFLIGK